MVDQMIYLNDPCISAMYLAWHPPFLPNSVPDEVTSPTNVCDVVWNYPQQFASVD
jgi:hypothetical protein